MTAQKGILLLDTNVWIDYYLPRGVRSAAAKQLVKLAIQKGYALAYPVHVLKDIFYLVARGMKQMARIENGDLADSQCLAIQQAAWACVENMRENASAVGADQSDVWLACKYRALSGDLEDNFVLAAAERAKPAMLVTSDETLLKKATVEAHTPADAVALLNLDDE